MPLIRLALLSLVLSACAYLPKAPDRDQENFTTRWSKDFSPYYRSGNSAYNRKTPLIYEDKLLVGEGLNHFSSYEIESGRKNWSIKEKSNIVASPIAINGIVIYGLANSELVARNVSDGTEKYRVKLSSSPNSKPVIIGPKIYISLEEHGIVAIDHQSGELAWTYQRPIAQETTLERGANPLVFRNQLITGFDDGYLVSLNSKDGLVTWEKRVESKGKFTDLDLKPLYAHRRLYVGGGNSGTFMIDPASGLIGKKIKATISASPIEVTEGILLGKQDGHVELLSAEGNFIRRVQLSESGISVLKKWGTNRIIAITYSGDVFTLDSTTLKPLKKMSLGHPDSTVAHDISISGDWAAIYTTRYRLYVLKK